MSKPNQIWRSVGMRHQTDTEWTKIPGAKITPADVEGEAAAGRLFTRIRQDGQRQILETRPRGGSHA